MRRQAARVLLLDDERRVLLQRASDPVDPAKGTWWELPGGGIEWGETSGEAARRELYEETGITGAEIGPCVWTRHVEFTFAGWRFDQDERIHVAWVEGSPTWRPAALEAFEALSFQGARWWTAQELAATGDQVWPSRLGALLPPIVAGDLPDPPLDVGE